MHRSNLERIMAAHGVTQVALADAMGITQQGIQRAVAGQQAMTRPRAERVAAALRSLTGQPILWHHVM